MTRAGAADASDNWTVVDTVGCAALFVFTTWYCASAPYNLYPYDEGYFLYEAKRIVDGDVFYRDFFNIVTPLAWYVMAAAYWLFGVTMATARTTMAVLHGVIAVSIVVTSRMVGIRRSLVAVLALSETAISYLAIERAAPHWFGTFWCVMVLVALLRSPLLTVRAAFVVGGLVGGVALSQQGRGVMMAWVPIVIMILDHRATELRVTKRATFLGCATAYGAGAGVVVGGCLLPLLIAAGWEPIYTALVQYPLVNYREVVRVPWGFYNPVLTPLLGPLIKYLSITVPLAALLRCVWQWRTSASPYNRPLVILLTVSIGALVGVQYGGSYEYIVLVGPVWFILLAKLVEDALAQGAQRWPRISVATSAAAAACVLLLLLRLANRRSELAAQWPLMHDTPFGRVNFASESDIAVNDAVREMTQSIPPPNLFVYPTAPGVYLLTGTENISRFQILVPGYSNPEHVQEVLDLLESRRQPYVIRNWIWMRNDIDPILPYLMQHYEKVKLPFAPKQMPTLSLFRRKPDTPAPLNF